MFGIVVLASRSAEVGLMYLLIRAVAYHCAECAVLLNDFFSRIVAYVVR